MSFLTPQVTTAEINGVERKFYSVSLKTFCELKPVVKTIAVSLAALLDPMKPALKERVASAEGNERVTFADFTVDHVKFGAAAREKAISDLVDALLEPKNAKHLQALIVDCLRDEYARGQKLTAEQVKELDEMDLPTALAFTKAIVASNLEALHPLIKGVTVEKARAAVAAVTPN